MRKHRVATLLAMSLAVLAAWTLAAAQPRAFRVAHLSSVTPTPDRTAAPALRRALRELGYVEGQNIVYEARFSEGRNERLPALAAELVALKVDVIVAQGGPAAAAAKAATSTIPIVIGAPAGDLVESVSSTASPVRAGTSPG